MLEMIYLIKVVIDIPTDSILPIESADFIYWMLILLPFHSA